MVMLYCHVRDSLALESVVTKGYSYIQIWRRYKNVLNYSSLYLHAGLTALSPWLNSGFISTNHILCIHVYILVEGCIHSAHIWGHTRSLDECKTNTCQLRLKAHMYLHPLIYAHVYFGVQYYEFWDVEFSSSCLPKTTKLQQNLIQLT